MLKSRFISIITSCLLAGSLFATDNTLLFDGDNDYIELGDKKIKLKTGSWELWFNVKDFTNGDCLISQFDGDGGNDIGGRVCINSDSKLLFTIDNKEGTEESDGSKITSTSRIEKDTWYHLAVTWDDDNNSPSQKLYINGILETESSDYNGTKGIETGSNPLTLGSKKVGDNTLNVEITEVAIWSDERTEDEIKEDKKGNIPIDSDNLEAYYNFKDISNNTLDDLTNNDKDGKLENFDSSSLITSEFDFNLQTKAVGFGKALILNGTDNYITLGTAKDMKIANHSFTVESWIKSYYLDNNDQTILGTDANGSKNYGLHLTIRDKQPYLGFYKNDIIGGSLKAQNRWYHLAYRYDLDTETQSILINGNEVVSETGREPFLNDTANLQIGKWGNGNYFNGEIDELRIWDTYRTITDIKDNMFNFNIDLTSSDLVAYYNFNDSDADDSINSFNGILEDNIGFTDSSIAKDTTPPTITFKPTDGTLDFDRHQNIYIIFSESIKNEDGTEITNINVDNLITMEKGDNNESTQPVDVVINNRKTIITIKGNSDWDSQTTYNIKINKVKGLWDNLTSESNITLKTAKDETAPYIQYGTFRDGKDTDISLSSDIRVTYNEPIQDIDLTKITLEKDKDKDNIDITVWMSDDKKTIIINPTNDLEPITNYTLNLVAVTDSINNAQGYDDVKNFKTAVKLEQPTNLTVNNLSTNTLTLNWLDNSIGEEGYYILQNNNIIKTLDANITTANISELNIETSYYFEVKSFKGDLNSKVTNISIITNSCETGYKDLNNVCTPKTCQDDDYNCPSCVGNQTLDKTANNGAGNCVNPTCSSSQYLKDGVCITPAQPTPIKPTKPEVVEPEVVEPEVVEPEIVEPEIVEPEIVEPEKTESELIEEKIEEFKNIVKNDNGTLSLENTTFNIPDDIDIQINDDGSIQYDVKIENGSAEIKASNSGEIAIAIKTANGETVTLEAPAGTDIQVSDDGSITQTFNSDSNSEVKVIANAKGEVVASVAIPKALAQREDKDIAFQAMPNATTVISEDGTLTSKNEVINDNEKVETSIEVSPNGGLKTIIVLFTENDKRDLREDKYTQDRKITYSIKDLFTQASLKVSSNDIKVNFTAKDKFSFKTETNSNRAITNSKITTITPNGKAKFEEIRKFNGERFLKLVDGESYISSKKGYMKMDIDYSLPKANKLTSNVLKIKKGWNLLSLPINQSIETTNLNAELIYTYDNDNWIKNPKILNYNNGFWLKSSINQNIKLDDNGDEYRTDFSQLTQGWNLVGTGIDLYNIKDSYKFKSVWSYKDIWQNSAEKIEAGQGFWVFIR